MTLLDYGYRSKCCKAPIKIGKKKISKTKEIVKVWVCCACKTKDVSIIPYEDIINQKTDENDLEEVYPNP